MLTDAAKAYAKDPLYQAALNNLQRGVWAEAARALDELAERYPLSGDLRALRREIPLRAKIDRTEETDGLLEKGRKVRTLAIRLATALLVVALAVLAVGMYAIWAGFPLDVSGGRLDQQAQEMELSAKLRDVGVLLQAGRIDEAQDLLAEISEVDPNFPGLEAALSVAEEAALVERLYEDAMTMVELEEWAAALAFLQQLSAKNPNYRDVSLQIESVETMYLISEILADAEADYEGGIWSTAVTGYESIRALDPGYKPRIIEARLFTSYVNAARAALLDRADSLEALASAEGYFRKALTIRPQDAGIKTERELARLYLESQESFTAGRWSDVITALEIVFVEEPDYADGTARQTLYEAYVARGDSSMAAGAYEAALDDFQRAATVAEQDRDAVFRLYEAHTMIAAALGAQGDYEAGVVHYRTAAEVGELHSRARSGSPALAAALAEAERYAAAGNFGVAYERYRLATRIASTSQSTITHVVEAGEYLTMLASRYLSTVRAIVVANDIADANLIFPGQQLLIPVLS